MPVCDFPGVPLVACKSASCVRENHPCQPGTKPGPIAVNELCETAGCGQMCNQETDTIEGATCGADGACVVKLMDPCTPYTCDPQTLPCKDGCKTNDDCAAGFTCDKMNGSICKQL